MSFISVSKLANNEGSHVGVHSDLWGNSCYKQFQGKTVKGWLVLEVMGFNWL